MLHRVFLFRQPTIVFVRGRAFHLSRPRTCYTITAYAVGASAAGAVALAAFLRAFFLA